MGAWGEKAFDNDSAMDWLGELGGVAGLRAALATAADTGADDYLDVDDGSAAIAAAELVAAALGGGRDRLKKQAAAWLDANPTAIAPTDRALAVRAVARVLAANSELQSLWADHGPDNDWRTDVTILVARLAGPKR